MLAWIWKLLLKHEIQRYTVSKQCLQFKEDRDSLRKLQERYRSWPRLLPLWDTEAHEKVVNTASSYVHQHIALLAGADWTPLRPVRQRWVSQPTPCPYLCLEFWNITDPDGVYRSAGECLHLIVCSEWRVNTDNVQTRHSRILKFWQHCLVPSETFFLYSYCVSVWVCVWVCVLMKDVYEGIFIKNNLDQLTEQCGKLKQAQIHIHNSLTTRGLLVTLYPNCESMASINCWLSNVHNGWNGCRNCRDEY